MCKSWYKINHLLGKQTNHTEIKGILFNDEILSDQSQVSSGLNENFSTIGRKLDQQLPADTNPNPVCQQSRTVLSFFILPVRHEECLKIIKKSKKL